MFGQAAGGGMDGNFLYYLGAYLRAAHRRGGLHSGGPPAVWKRLPRKVILVLVPILVLLGLLVSTAYLVDATYNPFLTSAFKGGCLSCRKILHFPDHPVLRRVGGLLFRHPFVPKRSFLKRKIAICKPFRNSIPRHSPAVNS